MKKIEINDKKFQMPTTWEECSPIQQAHLATVAILPKAEVARLHKEFAIITLLSIAPKWWMALELTPAQYHKLQQLTNFIWETKPTQLAQNFVSVVNQFGMGKKYYLPDNKLEQVSAIDLAWLMCALVNIGLAKTEADIKKQIDELIGIAARPLRTSADLIKCSANPHWNGDRRQPASQHGTAQNTKALANLSWGYKCLIYLYITGLIEQFTDEFSMLFKAESDTIQPDFPDGFGLEAHLRRVAKDGRFGIYEKVCDTSARTIWMNEVQLLLEAEAAEANYRKQNEKAA